MIRERRIAAVSKELQDVLRLLQWLEPSVALEVCRLAGAVAHDRWKEKRCTMPYFSQ